MVFRVLLKPEFCSNTTGVPGFRAPGYTLLARPPTAFCPSRTSWRDCDGAPKRAANRRRAQTAANNYLDPSAPNIPNFVLLIYFRRESKYYLCSWSPRTNQSPLADVGSDHTTIPHMSCHRLPSTLGPHINRNGMPCSNCT